MLKKLVLWLIEERIYFECYNGRSLIIRTKGYEIQVSEFMDELMYEQLYNVCTEDLNEYYETITLENIKKAIDNLE